MFDPWVRKIPWRRKWQPTPIFLPGKFHGQRNLESFSSGIAKSQTCNMQAACNALTPGSVAGEGSSRGHLCPSHPPLRPPAAFPPLQVPRNCPHDTHGLKGKRRASTQGQTLLFAQAVTTTHRFTHVQGHIKTFRDPIFTSTSWAPFSIKKNITKENSLVVQWFGLCALTAKSPGSIPGQGTKILQATPLGQKKKNIYIYTLYNSVGIKNKYHPS